MGEYGLEGIDPRVLGRRLREARRSRGLTQHAAADSLSVARATVGVLERGERRIRPSELIHLARLYGKAVSELVGPERPAANTVEQVHEIVRAYEEAELTEGQLARLLRVDRAQARWVVQGLTLPPHIGDGEDASLSVEPASSLT